ncbi:MAG: ion transporter [Rhodobacteraceae bacterium]|nr:ion transporter [Paracoccaceae bacterium]
MIKQINSLISSRTFSNFILAVILVNAVVLGLQTSKELMARTGPMLDLIDNICLGIFTIEIVLKLIVHRHRFFLSGWNNFDFVIVGISLLPGAGGLSVLRAMRIMRVLRVVSVAPSLRRVVEGFISALPGMMSVFVLMALIFYIFGVMATKLFGDTFPDWFGTLGESLYSLFQIMTLESWSMGIVRPVMEVHPYAWAFFVPFIMVTTFAVVNLVVGLIVTSMEGEHEAEDVAATDNYRDEVMAKLDALTAKVDAMREAK